MSIRCRGNFDGISLLRLLDQTKCNDGGNRALLSPSCRINGRASQGLVLRAVGEDRPGGGGRAEERCWGPVRGW